LGRDAAAGHADRTALLPSHEEDQRQTKGPRVIGPELPGRKGFSAQEVHDRLRADCLILRPFSFDV
jgi:hypothetical protein